MIQNPTSHSEIYSQGYRQYTGKRSGAFAAARSLFVHSTRSALGLGRPARYKIAPFIIIGLSYVNALAFVAFMIVLRTLGPGLEDIEIEMRFSDTILGATQMLLLFSAIVIPAMLIKDRRDGMFTMYVTTPLNRIMYIAAKTVAAWALLMLISVGPALLQLLGLTFADAGPPGIGEWVKAAVRILAAGSLMALLYASTSMAVSCFTNRAIIATVAVIVVLSVGGAVAGAAYAADYQPWLQLVSVVVVAVKSVSVIFGEDPGGGVRAFAVMVAVIVHLAGAGAILTWRYATLTEER